MASWDDEDFEAAAPSAVARGKFDDEEDDSESQAEVGDRSGSYDSRGSISVV